MKIRLSENQLIMIKRYILNDIQNIKCLSIKESINLNLSKQIRKYQLKQNVTPILDNIFGKNIYRLYYDLETGKQIIPKNKMPLLKFDVLITKTLKNNVEIILNKFGYSMVDFENNIAKNIKTNQQIKISKVINDTDFLIAKQYDEYLDALNKKYEGKEKLYAVISRHSHDIGSMSSKPNISSCEDLSDYNDIKDTAIINNFGEGYGSTIGSAIRSGLLVFYLINENDLNIQNPISRYLEGTICNFGNSYHFYGKFHENFKNFIINWMVHYNSTKGINDFKSDKELFKKNINDIKKILSSFNDKTEYNNFIRELVLHERFDVIYDMMCTSKYKIINDRYKEFREFDPSSVPNVINVLKSLFGNKIFKVLPDNIKTPISNVIKNELNIRLKSIINFYNILRLNHNRLEKKSIIKNDAITNSINSFIKDGLIHTDKMRLSILNETIPYGELSKLVNVEMFNQIKQYIIKIKNMSEFKNTSVFNENMKSYWTNVANKVYDSYYT
jgi:hypothetical protein